MSRRSLGAASVALVISGLYASGGGAQDIPPILQNVKRWRLDFDYEETASNQSTDEDWTLHITASGSAVLERTNDPYGEWIGTPQINVNYSYTGWQQLSAECSSSEEITGSGSPLDLADSAWLRFFSDGYQFDPGSHDVQVDDAFHYMCPEKHDTFLKGTRSWIKYDLISDSIPYPKMGTILQGSLQGESYANTEDTIGGIHVPSQVTLNYTLTPEEDELRLEIVDTGEYEKWRPMANLDGSPGSSLVLRAELVSESGETPQVNVESFIWTLRDTSAEPGIAMNFPSDSKDETPDLRFEVDDSSSSKLRAKGQEVERLEVTGFSDEQRVVSLDWGAWSTIEVRAILENGREIAGRARSTGELGLRLPKRAADSLVADAWKKSNKAKGADDSDADAKPSGDGSVGDGLSLYQEYRGFYVGGKHVEGDPNKKNLFVRTVESARPGVALFSRLSKLAVHSRLTEAELPGGRVINGNRVAGPGSTKQHAVVVAIAGTDGKDHGDPAATSRRGPVGEALGGPGTPKEVSEIRLMNNWNTLSLSKRNQVVAHELFHAVNVYHHGESDEVVVWGIDDDGDVAEVSKARGASKISVFLEQDTDITNSSRKRLSQPPFDETPLVLWLGREGGQHSGDDSCVMRYFAAQAYMGNPDVTRRYLVDAPLSSGFCSAAAGTGINDVDRQPQSRYGDASASRGACSHQLLVNDAVAPPRRPE